MYIRIYSKEIILTDRKKKTLFPKGQWDILHNQSVTLVLIISTEREHRWTKAMGPAKWKGSRARWWVIWCIYNWELVVFKIKWHANGEWYAVQIVTAPKRFCQLVTTLSWLHRSDKHLYVCSFNDNIRFKGLKPTSALLSRGISHAEGSWRTGQSWQGKKRLRSVVWARTKPPPSE